MVQANRRATVAQIAEEYHAGSDRKVSEYTVHHSLSHMGLHRLQICRFHTYHNLSHITCHITSEMHLYATHPHS